MTLRPGILRQPADEKGQPDGSAVTGKTRQPRVAEYDLVSQDAAAQVGSPKKLDGTFVEVNALVRVNGLNP
jgi:hypothetical protein